MSKVARNSKIAERRIESALAPGRFISDNVSFDFVRGLEAVENEISNLVRSDSKQAASLYESFLAGCYAKAEELNGSAWSFGQFVRELFYGWIKARQASRADPGDTAARLVAWMDDDPYGFCHRLEKDAVEVRNKTGLAALEKKIRTRFEAATPTEPVPGISPPSQDYQRRRSSEILRTIYISRRDIASYITLCKATRFTEADCQTLATMLLARRKPADALYWVERGLALGEQISGSSTESNDLLRLKRELLTKLGRRDEAIHAGWTEFTGHPSEFSYEELMKYVPKAEKEAWHKKAIEAAIGTDLDLLLPLLLERKELERLADLAGRSEDSVLERVNHLTTKPAARKLEKTHPGIAARLWRVQGMHILDVKKSKYYPETLQNFRCARRCYERAGLSSEWLRVVDQLRADHHRKVGFMAGFEELVAGKPPSKKHHFSTRRGHAGACHRLRTRNKATPWWRMGGIEMDLEALKDTPPWDWPEGTAGELLRIVRKERAAAERVRFLAIQLAGDFTVVNEELVDALLAVLHDSDESEKSRARAAISLGPVLEYMDTEDIENEHFDDENELPISAETFERIQASLRTLYEDAKIPKEVRRRILEASVRAPEDWHVDAIRVAYASDDEEWKLTAVFCMRFVRGFDEQIVKELDSKNADIHFEAVVAAGNWGVEAAWPHVTLLIHSAKTPKPLLLAAIEAVPSIRPKEAMDVLSELRESDDEEIVDAIDEALAMAGEPSEEDEEDGDDLFLA